MWAANTAGDAAFFCLCEYACMCVCVLTVCVREKTRDCVCGCMQYFVSVFVCVRVCGCVSERANRSFLNEGENERSVRISHRKKSPVSPISSISLNFFPFFPFFLLYPLFLLSSPSSSVVTCIFMIMLQRLIF